MLLKQKKIGCKRVFDIKDDYLIYSTEDEASGFRKKIDFFDFPPIDEHFEYIEKNVLFLFLGGSFLGIGAIQYVITEFFTGEPRFSMLTIGTVLFLIYFFSRTKFTAISTTHADITVMKDENHAKILEEIYSRRALLLRDAYAHVFGNTSFEDEVKRFEQLFGEDVINKKEFADLKSDASQIYGCEKEKIIH